MQKSGPIIVIEDDLEDQELLEETSKVLNYPNQVIFFSDGFKAIEYIEKTSVTPFLIISDVNMPTINGFELQRKFRDNEILRARCIPYLFLTTSAHPAMVRDAYAMATQGFFIKPNTMADLRDTIRRIIEYWQQCFSPEQYIVN